MLQPKGQRLQVSETISLGEKRFIAVVQVDGARFLIGGSSSSVSLLTELKASTGAEAFGSVLATQWPERETA
jgi:flagellar biogenesis protein FliO